MSQSSGRPGSSLRTAGRAHRTRRLLAASAAAALVVSIFVAEAFGSSRDSRDRAASLTATVIDKHVGAPGIYAVTVLVRSSTASLDRVDLVIGNVQRRATVDRRRHARIKLRVDIAAGSLTVRAVGRHARPKLSVKLRRVAAVPAAPPHPSSTPPTTTTTATSTTSTTTTTATSTASAPPTGPPGPGPYQSLVWSDNFVSDWHNEGSGTTEPIPNTWAYDNYGGCGDTPGADETSYPAAAGDAYLTSQGLTIPVTQTGANQYTSAQLDTRTISGESWQYGTIEASIVLPEGQGLCPAFWMYSNTGTAEIDILEAPSFVSGSFGAYAPYTIFTLHDNDTQVFESYTTPPGWNQAGANVYGVIWTPTSITWTVNYVPYAEATESSLSDPSLWSTFDPSSQSGYLHLLLDDAVGGWPGDPPTGTTYSQPMTVQWVDVFQ